MLRHTNGGCVSRRGTPLRAYFDEATAAAAASHAKLAHGHRMVPYRCDRCGSWHLTPADRHTPGHYCDACSKQAYGTEEGAERRARILWDERGVSLRVYECPYGEGWHLTSRP